METEKTSTELEHEILDFMVGVFKQYKMRDVIVHKAENDFSQGVCTIYLQRYGKEQKIVLSRDDVTLAGRRRRAAQQIKDLVEEMGRGE